MTRRFAPSNARARRRAWLLAAFAAWSWARRRCLQRWTRWVEWALAVLEVRRLERRIAWAMARALRR